MANKKITIADIASKLNLSPTTVSFVLNDRDQGISETTRQAVLQAARRMGYRKPAAQNTRPGWIRVAYLTSRIEFFNFHTSFFANVYSQLQRSAHKEQLEFFLQEFNPEASFGSCSKHLEELRAMEVDVCLSNSALTVSSLMSAGFKCILAQGGIAPNCVCVYCDDYEAGRQAALYALKMGHRQAGMIFPSEESRFRGFHETFLAGGGTCNSRHIWPATFDHHANAAAIEKKAATAGRLPALFYCFADNLMFPAIRGFTKAGFRIPDDISLIGTDNLFWGSIATPAFTTVDLNEELFAVRLIEAIRHVRSGGAPYQQSVPVKLIPRETVKKL